MTLAYEAYISNVTEKVQAKKLQAASAAYGSIVALSIDRELGTAFAKYSTSEGLWDACAANPLLVCGEFLFVQPCQPHGRNMENARFSNSENLV